MNTRPPSSSVGVDNPRSVSPDESSAQLLGAKKSSTLRSGLSFTTALPRSKVSVCSPLPVLSQRLPAESMAGPAGDQIPASRDVGTLHTSRSPWPSVFDATTLPMYAPQSPNRPP